MPLGMLGKYERLDVLGHGASGIVYLAKDVLLGRRVALKEISAQGDERDRVLDEARVLDRLRHPNIVEVLSVDEIEGKVCIAMEYIRGRSLLETLRETPILPPAQAVEVAAQICDGLAYAHSHRIVHRDVKPANILIERDGRVKLVDFGLAQVLGTHSFAGGAGTYAYMAPEDFHEEEQSDHRADIWAVGVVLCEMLTGRRPFQAARPKDPFSWKRAIEDEPITPPSQIQPDVPSLLDAVVARALSRDLAARYQDAAQMAADLRAAVGASPARPTFIPDPAPRAEPSEASVGTLWLAGLPPLGGIDDFLAAAPDHWESACDALTSGALAAWLDGIGETPLAAVAREIAASGRFPDDGLREFLYRAGVDTQPEARLAFDSGKRLADAGRTQDAVPFLRRAVRLDPSRPAYHQELARALRATEPAVIESPKQRVLAASPDDLAASAVTFSTQAVDFGTLRRGQTRAASVILRHAGPGVLQGRVASAPGWVNVEPAAFTTRQRQKLTLTARTENVWQSDESYRETVVLETTGGRHEIAVQVGVLPPRRTLADVFWWFVPLLFCALLPAVAGVWASHFLGYSWAHGLWQPGMVTSALLCGAVFVLTMAAETTWLPRLIPLALLGLNACGGVWMLQDSDRLSDHVRVALIQSATPVVVLLVLQAIAAYSAPRTWGRWTLWAWITALTGVLTAYGLLHVGGH